MSAPDIKHLEASFHQALSLPHEEREAFIQTASAGDAVFADQLRSMIQSHENSRTEFLKHSRWNNPLADQAHIDMETSGAVMGNYKLLQQLGEGGFGTVWLAEQRRPIRRRVALKIIKLGMDTKEVVARFEQERQALAMMDHPNIARVYEAGATELGRPYFAMEVVQGVRITDYCDDVKASTGERLALFIQVCKAVQHAHQKGIIHRDLKPSNILVISEDGRPSTKIIDFGIAKATQALRLTEATVFTRFEQIIGTPAYMSPEQAQISAIDIDTRSDVYSLGVLLYELLTGRTPLESKELMARDFDEVRRIIREDEPRPPSSALLSLSPATKAKIASSRQCDHRVLRQQLKGDLDCIVMTALAKERDRRYQSVAILCSDVEKHSKQEPVSARPAGVVYRIRKFINRNKWPVAVVATLVAGVEASVAIALSKGEDAIRADRAEEEYNNAIALQAADSRSFLGRARQRNQYLRPLERQGLSYRERFTPEMGWYLEIIDTGYADLSTLRGSLLSDLAIFDPKFSDLGSLSEFELDSLDLRGTNVKDFRPLTTMRLKRVHLDGCASFSDLTLLSQMSSLESLTLSGTKITDLQALSACHGLRYLRVNRTDVKDLGPLAHSTLNLLDIGDSHVTDLQPLIEACINALYLNNTDVTDLSPVSSSHLKELYAGGCDELTDLSPLMNCPNLERIVLPPNAINHELLYQLPTLRTIIFE